MVVRVDISLYWLEQSGRQWAGLLVDTVIEDEMGQCRTDPCAARMIADGKVE